MAVTLVEMPITLVVQETHDTRTFRLEPPPDDALHHPEETADARHQPLQRPLARGHYLPARVRAVVRPEPELQLPHHLHARAARGPFVDRIARPGRPRHDPQIDRRSRANS